MRIDVPARRRSRLSLTPLIDVIFLLLLFFMLSSTFSRYSEMDFSQSGGGAATASQPDIILTLSVDELKINGVERPLNAFVEELEKLKQAGAKHVLLLVDGTADTQDFVTVLSEARKTGMPVTIARRSP